MFIIMFTDSAHAEKVSVYSIEDVNDHEIRHAKFTMLSDTYNDLTMHRSISIYNNW